MYMSEKEEEKDIIAAMNDFDLSKEPEKLQRTCIQFIKFIKALPLTKPIGIDKLL